MDIGVAVAVALGVALIVVLLRGTGGQSRVISGMWRYHGAGWPTGVQEDDDAHWSWTKKAAPRAADADDAARNRPDPGDMGLTVDVAPVGYEVRSPDRDRS